MKLSFDVRYCIRPPSFFSSVLDNLPLASNSPCTVVCSRWSPVRHQQIRIFYSALMLLAVSTISYLYLIFKPCHPTTDRSEPVTKDRYEVPRWSGWPYPQIAWQSFALAGMLYIVMHTAKFPEEAELLHLLPMGLVMFCVDLWYTVTVSEGIEAIDKSCWKMFAVMFRIAQWTLLLGSITCAITRRYADCEFLE